MRKVEALAISLLWPSAAILGDGCAHNLGNTVGASLAAIGVITTATGVMIATGGCVTLDENDPSFFKNPDQYCQESDPDPETGLKVVAAGLGVTAAGAGVMAAAADSRRSARVHRYHRIKPRAKELEHDSSKNNPIEVTDQELAFMTRIAEQKPTQKPLGSRCHKLDLTVHDLPGKETNPACRTSQQ